VVRQRRDQGLRVGRELHLLRVLALIHHFAANDELRVFDRNVVEQMQHGLRVFGRQGRQGGRDQERGGNQPAQGGKG
jgi:hypothetical protein